MPPKARTIDEYLARVDASQRSALKRVRAAIRAAAPGATECICYGLPAFRFDGKVVMAFRAAEKHCALHPMSGTIVAAHRAELADYDTSPGTIRFQPSDPPPARLIRLLVRARIAENLGLRRPAQTSKEKGASRRAPRVKKPT
jgi:uncharacterized protein YdhG (YjbR/CyaY superfamily)